MSTEPLPDDYFDDDELGDDVDDEEWPFDCHMDRHGWCGAAGSEECEFECPYRAAQIAAAERKRKG